MLDEVDTDHVFSTRYGIAPTKGKTLPQDLRVEVRVSGRDMPMKMDPDGRMHLPARQDWIDAGAKLHVNQPKAP